MFDFIYTLQAIVFEHLVQPVVLALGLGGFLVQAFDSTLWLLIGLGQIVAMVLVLGPLQRWLPVQAAIDNREVRADVIYTLLHRLGLFRLLMFFSIEPWINELLGWLRVAGVPSIELDQWWPSLSDQPVASFLLYLVVLDFVNYWIHRGQHQWHLWWQLHALHHSQQHLTMWSDNRNHLLDSVLVDMIYVVLAFLIGVPPGQFLLLVALSQLFESFQHANVKIWFGVWGERLLISPRFHRFHHSIESAPENEQQPTFGGHNFGVLFPWWDMLFGTANFERRFEPTGLRDQIEQGREYGTGFWRQQWLGLLRLAGKA